MPSISHLDAHYPIQWAPLCRGHLARPPSEFGATLRSQDRKVADYSWSGSPEAENDLKIIERVQEIAKKRGWTMSAVALAWVNRRVSSSLVGFSSIKRLDEALDAVGKTLTLEEEKYLEELYVDRPIDGHT